MSRLPGWIDRDHARIWRCAIAVKCRAIGRLLASIDRACSCTIPDKTKGSWLARIGVWNE
ncbi:hypothetical protein ACXYL9_01130 [Qipengyuania sp. CAU 1752]